jgi:hypothetical protein
MMFHRFLCCQRSPRCNTRGRMEGSVCRGLCAYTRSLWSGVPLRISRRTGIPVAIDGSCFRSPCRPCTKLCFLRPSVCKRKLCEKKERKKISRSDPIHTHHVHTVSRWKLVVRYKSWSTYKHKNEPPPGANPSCLRLRPCIPECL